MRNGLVAVALVCASLTANADTPSTVEQLLGPEAFAQYTAGKAHYDVQNYDAAIAAFRAAYQLNQHPLLVFAIAKAQQKNHDCPGSIESLQRFVRTDPGPDWVKRASEEIEHCEAEVRAEADRKQQAAALESRRAAWQATFDQTRARAATRRRWSYAIAATGVASVAGAALALNRAGNYFDDARNAPTSDAYTNAVALGDRWTTTSIVLGVIGGVAIAGGATLWLTAPTPPAMPAELRAAGVNASIAPSRSGLSVVVGGVF